MIKFLYWFTIFLCAYFVLYVTGTHYLSWISYAWYVLPIIKELTWLIFVWYCVWVSRDQLRAYMIKTQRELLLLLGIALWGIVATLLLHGVQGYTMINILIWLKYGLYSSIIFYTAARVWYSSPLTQSDITNYIKRLCTILIYFCGIGLIWQWLKWIHPELFYNMLWYGPVWDYAVWHAHPIYYRTWPGWWPRFSWLMSGPNNLWYLLVAYASILPLYIKQRWWRAIYYGSMVMTLSRAAIVWVWAQLFPVAIRQYGRTHKWLVISIIVVVVIWVWVLSVAKWLSTLEHFTRSRWAVLQVIQNPRGIWLWSSWPWVHWGGSVLPENFYLQLLLDYGTIPFIARCVYWYRIIRRSKRIASDQHEIAPVLHAYVAGFVWLLIVWLFLHVFEDSVVNYLFFVPFGLLWWYGLRPFAKSWSSEYNKDK